MRSKEEAFRILETALGIVVQPGESVEVALLGGRLGLTRFADNEVTQAIEMDRESLSLRVIVGGRCGRVETSDLSIPGIQAAARQARTIAQLLPKRAPPVELPAMQSYWPIEAFDSATDRISALDRMAIVGRTIVQAHQRKLLAAGHVSTRRGPIETDQGDGIYAIANSNGLMAYHAGTRAGFSVTMARSDGLSGWAETASYALGELDLGSIPDIAARKALLPGAVQHLTPGDYTVILEPAAVAALLAFVGATSGATDFHAELSFLSGRLGERVVGEAITIYDDYGHPLHRGTPFDIEGVARRKMTILERGVAKAPVYSLESARRWNTEPTGHKQKANALGREEGAEHLVMVGGDSTLADLIGSTRYGVLVSRFWYTQMVDPRRLLLTGMTRDGTFLIEKGEIVAPLSNLRFNISLLDLLSHVEGLTAPVWASDLVVPALRAHGFRFSSRSPDPLSLR